MIIVLVFFLGTIFGTVLNNQKSSTITPRPKEIQSIITFSKLGQKGRLGNQLFEIATVIAVAEDNNCKVILPKNKCQFYDLCDVPYDIVNMRGYKTIPIYETDNYEDILIPKDGRLYDIIGYRQSYRYFNKHGDKIRHLLKPKQEIIDRVRNKLNDLGIDQYIGLHIRFTDSGSDKLISKMYNYFVNSLKFINQSLGKKLKVVVCTDQPSKVNLNKIPNGIISPFDNSIDDFVALYLSDHLIMSISTLSWMAGWLGDQSRIIIMPTPWWDPNSMPGKLYHLTGSELEIPEWHVMSLDGQLTKHQQINKNKPLDFYRFLRYLFI